MVRTIDHIPLWAVFLITTLILFTSAEIGFHLGKWRKRRSKNEEKGQTGALVGAALTMLAFLLAFTFGMAGSIHNAKKSVLLEEANAHRDSLPAGSDTSRALQFGNQRTFSKSMWMFD